MNHKGYRKLPNYILLQIERLDVLYILEALRENNMPGFLRLILRCAKGINSWSIARSQIMYTYLSNSSFLWPFWFIRRHLNQNFSWATVNFCLFFSKGKSSGARSTWSSAMFTYFKFAARAIKPHFHATSGSIRSETGSQWRLKRMGVMWSHFLERLISLAAAFCTDWSFFMSVLGTLYSRELQWSSLAVTKAWITSLSW